MRSLAIVLLACLLLSCGGHRASAPEASRAVAGAGIPRFGDADPHDWEGIRPWQYPVHGIDVSKYQGDIDWHRVRASGIDFAFIKATEGGDHADDRFEQNWARRRAPPVCRAAPITTTTSAVRRRSRWPGSSTTSRARRGRCRRCSTSSGPTSRGPVPTARTPPTIRREALLFLQALNVYYGKRPVIYTTVDFYRDNDLGRLQGFHFWLRSVAGHPSDVYPDQRWAFWQYTGTGLVEGIDGLTDINVFGGTPLAVGRLGGEGLTPAAGQWVSLMESSVSARCSLCAQARDPECQDVQPREPVLEILELLVGIVAVGAGEGGDRPRPRDRQRHRRAVHQPVVLGLLEHRRRRRSPSRSLHRSRPTFCSPQRTTGSCITRPASE